MVMIMGRALDETEAEIHRLNCKGTLGRDRANIKQLRCCVEVEILFFHGGAGHAGHHRQCDGARKNRFSHE